MAKYANIIIDISHEKLDKTFQYRIPPEIKDEITEGMQVIVPFGNRTIKGYVLELTDKAEFDTTKLKDIKAVDNNAMQIESQFIALAAWMRKNYGGTMNQALKTVIPIKEKAKEKKSRLVRLVLPFNEAASLLEELKRKHRTARARLLEALLEETVLSYDVITKKLHITADVIKAMMQQGVITVEEVRTYRNPVRTQEMGAYTLTLNAMQQKVVDAVIENARTEKKPCLIHGVTGSGKTEVYMELIAEAAVGFIHDGDSIILDAGSTVLQMVPLLSRFNNITVMTNSLHIVNALSELDNEQTILMPGGTFRKKSASFHGQLAENAFEHFTFDKLFMGTDGIDLNAGVTTFNEVYTVSKAMCNAAREVILMADSSKFGRKSPNVVCSLESVDKLITDAGIDPAFRQALEEKGIDVIITGESNE